ncbi:hypothetical protein FM101_02540 [Arthrobacter rhombi]|uniref:Uncharacterized protein n=1 Tax=Arthrobacter rhombi TaxID=71253 RepID=A0A1R4F6Z0_9MICC|nr:hypothetical protein FM101_02540 [Arthrobacter rhombi]
MSGTGDIPRSTQFILNLAMWKFLLTEQYPVNAVTATLSIRSRNIDSPFFAS